YPGHNITSVINYSLQFLLWDIQDQSQTIRYSMCIPHVSNWRYETNMTHALSSYASVRHVYTTTITNNPPVTYRLVPTTETLKILGRTKYPLIHQSVWLCTESTVIDSLCFSYLAMTPGKHFLWGG